MQYIKNGKIYDSIKVVQIDSMNYLHPTHEQILQAGYEVLTDEAKTLLDQRESLQTTHQIDKLSVLLDSISVEAPSGGSINDDGTVNLPHKVGYKWTPIYDASASKISYQLVEDADACGTADNPIIFAVDMPLIPNAYYTKDSVRKVYMGTEGTVEDETIWSDETKFVEF